MDSKMKMIDRTDERVRTLDEIVDRFWAVYKKFSLFDKSPHDYGVNELLTPVEIHTVVAIDENPAINVRNLAEKMDVTKGAISQMIKKLEKRNLIRKVKGMENDKEVLLVPTEKGKKASAGHEARHRKLNEIALKQTAHFSLDDLKRVSEFFKIIEGLVDIRLKEQREQPKK
jgi:DNA-binding MarR family transcriptional regulator